MWRRELERQIEEVENEGRTPICTSSHNPGSSHIGCSWLSDILSKQFLMVTREPVGNLPATRHANIRRRNKGILQISPPTSSRVCISRYQRRHVTDKQRNSILTWNLHLGKVVFVLVTSALEKYRKYSTLLKNVYVLDVSHTHNSLKKVKTFKNKTNNSTRILFVTFINQSSVQNCYLEYNLRINKLWKLSGRGIKWVLY